LNKFDNIIHRYTTLKNYLMNRNWDKSPTGALIEFDLVRDVAENLYKRKPSLQQFRYIYDYEWEMFPERIDKGKGDLVFTNGKNNFLIVECKFKYKYVVGSL